MIEIKKLVKTYGIGKTAVKALKGVSFTLPDKGFVFIVGKSGSGKSTLLNCLGGLDDSTSGEILVNQEDITKLKPHQLDNYRNYFVGIVYQHFNLFEEDNVINNIKVASDIADHKISDEEISNLLDKLDLTEKKHKLVRELSGGQKQRVAIARALIKNPHMILADEPTGNLDSNTSKLIFDVLQEISKDKLVVVISHDMNNAKTYADRIIEISDGLLVSDKIRNPRFKESNEQRIIISDDSNITNEKLNEIKTVLADKGLAVFKRDDHFVKSNKPIESNEPKADFNGRNRSWRNTLKLARSFIKTSKASLIVAVLVSTIIVGLLSLAHGFAQYDGATAINEVIARYNSKSIIYNKAYSFTDNYKNLNKKYTVEITENDINAFKNTNYNGEIYPIYPICFDWGTKTLFRGYIYDDENLKNIFTTSSYGVMQTNDNYLKKLFGDYKVLAGSTFGLDKSTDVVITDYLADSILLNHSEISRNDGLPITSEDKNDPYQGLLGSILTGRLKVAAVIQTDYQSKYITIYQMYQKLLKEPQNAGDIAKELYGSDLFQRFVDDVKGVYGIAYTTNPNFYEDYLDSGINDFVYTRNVVINDVDYNAIAVYGTDNLIYGTEMEDNEILINSSLYSTYFPDDDLKEDKYIIFQSFGMEQNSSETPRIEKKLKVKGTFTSSQTSNLFKVSNNNLKELKRSMLAPYALCFDKVEGSYPVNMVATSRYFYTSLNTFTAVFSLIDIVAIFSQVFMFIAILLVLLVTLVIVSHNLRIIRKNQYRLGVYKSLGYSSVALSDSTILNSLFMVLLVMGLSTVFALLLSSSINSLLASAFVNFLGSEVYSGLTLVSFSFPILCIYIGIVAFLGVVSTFIPVISIRKIKPNIIINKAE